MMSGWANVALKSKNYFFEEECGILLVEIEDLEDIDEEKEERLEIIPSAILAIRTFGVGLREEY